MKALKELRLSIYTVFIVAMVCLVGLAGCSAYQTAQGAHTIVGNAITLAQDELPGLTAAGIFSAQESSVASGWLTGAVGLNNQFESCITNANQTTLKTAGKFVACLNIFAAGLNDPKELAQLKVLNPKAQAKVQIWTSFIAGAINVAITDLGGMTNATPQISATPATSAELKDFARQAGVAYGR